MRTGLMRDMLSAADTLEARADGNLPMDAHDMARLAVTLRDWVRELVTAGAGTTPIAPPPARALRIIQGGRA